MRLSEAMELGHALIDEHKKVFFSPRDNCGCALGSVVAASTNKESWRPLYSTREIRSLLGKKFPGLLVEQNLLLADDEYNTLKLCFITGTSLINQISFLHSSGIPRLEIAKRLRELEDKGLIPWIEDAPVEKQATTQQEVNA